MLTSCKHDYLVPADIQIPDTVKFSVNIIPIFNKSCNSESGCHTASGGVAPDLTPENAYSNLFMYGLVDTSNAESSTIYLIMSSATDPMPPDGKLPGGETKLVLAWIEQGAKNN